MTSLEATDDGVREAGRSARVAVALVLLGSLTAAQIGGPKDLPPRHVVQRFARDGVAVEFSLSTTRGRGEVDPGLVAGADALVKFRITDERTGEPIAGLHPLAWIDRRPGEHPPVAAQVRDRIASFMGGLLSITADMDLNSYLALTLNHDATISVIDPLLSFSITRLRALITLPGTGLDWTLDSRGRRLFVTIPDQSLVAVIDTETMKMTGTLSTGEGTAPTRIVLQPDGTTAWVGLDHSSRVVAIDVPSGQLVDQVDVGAGLHTFAFDTHGDVLFVTNTTDDTVTVIDTSTRRALAHLDVSATPVAAASSPASGLLYVVGANGGEVTVIDPAGRLVVGSVPVGRGVVAMRFAPGGRFGFLVNQVENTVLVLDASNNTIVDRVEVVPGPDQVVFTEEFAYVRGTGSPAISILSLASLGKEPLAPAEILAGRLAPDATPEHLGVADMIAPTPEDNAVMIANPADRVIQYYVEGMLAPMGTFRNYKRNPRALLVLDRALNEEAPGVYATATRLTDAGVYDVFFVVDQPRIVHSLTIEIASSPDAAAAQAVLAVAVEPLFGADPVQMGQTVPLQFRLTDPITGVGLEGLDDVRVQVFRRPGSWLQRWSARSRGDGVYEIRQAFPESGVYNLQVAVESRGLHFQDLWPVEIRCLPNGARTPSPATSWAASAAGAIVGDAR